MKKPRAKLARGFFSKPSRSCLAVFYVEQVALNRHVPSPKSKDQQNQKVYRQSRSRQPELFQPVKGGISRFENDGSAVLEESWCSHRLLRSATNTSSKIIVHRRSIISFLTLRTYSVA